MPANEVLFVVVALFLVVVWGTRQISAYRLRRRLAEQQKLLDDQRRQELESWKEIISTQARHLLTGETWRDNDGKVILADILCDGIPPKEMLFALGEAEPTEEELARLSNFFGNSPEDLEVASATDLEIGRTLKVTNANKFMESIFFSGRICPLFEFCCPFPGQSELVRVNIVDCYKEKKKSPT